MYNTVSGEEIVYNIFDEYNVKSSDWVVRALGRWIAQGLALIGMPGIWQPCTKEIDVESYKGKLPCDIKVLNHLEYDGYVLPSLNESNHQDNSNITERQYSCDNYVLGNNGYIHTTFETGTVKVHYLCPQTEYCKRYNIQVPRIPDDIYVKDAITWYVLYRILSRGYVHPVYGLESRNSETNPAIQWKESRRVARIKIQLPDAYDREALRKLWTTMWLSPNNFYHTYFNNTAGGDSSTTSNTATATYTVSFVINVNGATITISPDPGVTISGTTMSVVRELGNYSYTISKSGYTTQTGSINVIGNNVSKTIILV